MRQHFATNELLLLDLVFTAQEGGTAYMGCEVHNLSNKTVSWLRERDRHILTVDRETFISDRRFVALHTRTQISDMVTLSIHSVEMRDAGKYQCQVSAQNKISRSVELIVVRPQVKTKYYTVKLQCKMDQGYCNISFHVL